VAISDGWGPGSVRAAERSGWLRQNEQAIFARFWRQRWNGSIRFFAGPNGIVCRAGRAGRSNSVSQVQRTWQLPAMHYARPSVGELPTHISGGGWI
jgi:hypothetical protein